MYQFKYKKKFKKEISPHKCVVILLKEKILKSTKNLFLKE